MSPLERGGRLGHLSGRETPIAGDQRLNKFETKNHRLAGRSARRRMK